MRISKFHLEIRTNYQYLIFPSKMPPLPYSSPLLHFLEAERTMARGRQRKRLKRHRFFALCPVFPSKGVRKPRKRTMAQSKNRLMLAIKRHALSIHERKTWSTRCTWSRETFVQARLETFRTQRIFPRICRKYNSRKSGTDVRQIYPPPYIRARENQYIIYNPSSRPLFRRFRPGYYAEGKAHTRHIYGVSSRGGYVSFSSNYPKSVAESFGNGSVPCFLRPIKSNDQDRRIEWRMELLVT